MGTKRYVALLRGINVGGRNPVAMADLRGAFEAEGYGSVSTYIQSGNVLFEADGSGSSLETEITSMLERRLGLDVVLVVRSQRQLRAVIDNAPDGFGDDPDRYHADVLFLKGPLSSRAALRVVELREDVDRAWQGTGVLYFQRLSARRAQSRLSRLAGTPEYQQMTIRNWNTTTKLLDLCKGPDGNG